MMKKRWLSALVAATLAAAVLTGCGSKDTAEEGNTSDTSKWSAQKGNPILYLITGGIQNIRTAGMERARTSY